MFCKLLTRRFLIGALIAVCGNFVMLLMKYKGVWAK